MDRVVEFHADSTQQDNDEKGEKNQDKEVHM
jgi:hypothetical protein